MSKVVAFNPAEMPPVVDQHGIAEFLREMADDIDKDEVAEIDFCAIVAIRRDTGVPILATRSKGRFMNQLEWAGVLDFLQHQNYDDMKAG